jgi:hypothetical protein
MNEALKLNPKKMKKYLRKVVKTFKLLMDAKLLTFAPNVVSSMTAAVESFPTPTPALVDISNEIDTYSGLLQSAANRDKVQVALKNQSKKALLLMLSQLADYVNMVAQGNEVMLAESGFDLNKVPQPISMKAPTGLVLLDGGNTGELVLKFRRVAGALSYLYQYTTDPLLPEESWVSIAATTTSLTFTGLTKGVTYYCRVIAIGGYQQRMNSIVVNRVSQ